VHQIAGSAQLIGWLYGINTLGAGIGAFIGGWFLLGTIGFDKAIYVGAALNLIVAAGGLLLARSVDMAGGEARPKVVRLRGVGDGTVWRWSLLVFISGFLIVALQIVWYRLVGVLLQSNGYSFSLVLAVFLLGDGAGLLVGARIIDRIADPRRFFFLMQGVATTLALCGAWFVYLAIGAGASPSSFVNRDFMGGSARDIVVIALLLSVVVLPAYARPVLLGSDRPIPYAREKVQELLARPEIDAYLAVARVDRAVLRIWFEDHTPLNHGKVVPATAPNTDFFPRDEYYLNRP
jgi:hypothetical protein